MSRGISAGKQGIKDANTSKCGRVCLFSQNKTTILVMQNVQFEFRQFLHHYCLLCERLQSLLHAVE